MNKWDERFMGMANLVATWSKDPNKQVGAVIVDSNNRVVSVGFNGLPKDMIDNPALPKKDKLATTVHAEVNAILFAKQDLTGCRLYSTFPICASCASVIIQSGIETVHMQGTMSGTSSWRESCKLAEDNMVEAGVEIYCMRSDL